MADDHTVGTRHGQWGGLAMTFIQGDPLDRELCLTLLARSTMGRLGLVLGPMPFVHPVRYHVSRSHLLFGLPVDQLAREVDDVVVALQADGFDEDRGRYWTVVAIGPSTPVAMTWEAPSDIVCDGLHAFRLRPKLFSGHWLGPPTEPF
jgi:Pyridoxamine 5'-phosphate oxidase